MIILNLKHIFHVWFDDRLLHILTVNDFKEK